VDPDERLPLWQAGIAVDDMHSNRVAAAKGLLHVSLGYVQAPAFDAVT
jgi:hypothetical protein